MQSGAPLAMTLIIQPIVLDLQARGEVSRAEHPHGDRQILSMTTRTRRDVLRAVVSAVGARRAVPRTFDRLHLFPADTQAPGKVAELFRKAGYEPREQFVTFV